MQLKKQINTTIICFEILNDSAELQYDNILEDLINSLEDANLIHKAQPFDDLIRMQQQHPKHILTAFNPKPYDLVKMMIAAIYNFLIITNQYTNFMIRTIELSHNNKTVIAFDSEGLLVELDGKNTYAPLVRSYWRNPMMIEKILGLQHR